jgi:hypothetical protein
MTIRNALLILILALLLLANGVAATKCVIYVVDESHQALNGASIYMDDWSQLIGKTTFNTQIGWNCWVGDIQSEGEHTLNAKWNGIARFRPPHEGSATVNIAGITTQFITIVTHKV